MKHINSLLIITVLAVSSCGSGGSSNSNNTSSSDVFYTTEVGTVYSTELTGTEWNDEISGTYSITVKEPEMFDGILVSPREEVLTYSDTTITNTTYTDSFGNLVAYKHKTSQLPIYDDDICRPISPEKLPSILTVGDSGLISALTCKRGEDDTGEYLAFGYSWTVENAGNGKVNLVIDNGNTIRTFTLSKGKIIGFKDYFSYSYCAILEDGHCYAEVFRERILESK